MSRTVTPLQERIREAAKELKIDTGRVSLATKIGDLRNKTLRKWGALTEVRTSKGVMGLENFEAVPSRNHQFDAVQDADIRDLMFGLKDLGMSGRHIEQTTEQCVGIFDDGYDASNVLRGNGSATDSYVSLSKVIGRSAATNLARMASEGPGLEAFGDDINRLNTDDRLTMDLIIMRPWDNIMDKALARVPESSPVVTIKVPAPSAYDWAATQVPGSTLQSRNYSNDYKLRDLYRNPTPVNSAPQLIVPVAANDSTSVLSALGGGSTYFKTNVDVAVLDLARNAAVFTSTTIDRTDLISDGGIINNVIIGITATVATVSHTEYFLLNTRPFDMAMYVLSPNNRQSGQRQVMMEAVLPISATTLQYNGSASVIAAALTDAKIQASIRINSTLNIQTGALQASGSVSLALLPLANGGAPGATTEAIFGSASSAFDAYSVELYYDEENQRKANLAIWVQYFEQQFVVPRARVYFTEYSLTQDIDENAVAATSSVVALGNGRRGLDIVVNALNDISEGLQFAASNPEIVSVNTMDEQSFAASLVKPTVITSTINFASEEVNVMNESTRLSEMHGRFRARILSMVTNMFAQSLMLNQYKAGETPVLKAWVHSTIADLVIGILDYHPDLKDKESVATGADYSMLLPNGYRLDVIKSNLDCLIQRMYVVPVIETDMASVISAASIRDCGTVTTNYTPTNSGAVVRRVATTTREIVMMSNKVGLMLQIEGLETQLGTSGFSPMLLSADFNPNPTL